MRSQRALSLTRPLSISICAAPSAGTRPHAVSPGVCGRPLPFLVLSGATDGKTLKELAASGVAWLTKPADPDAIAAAIFDLCASATPSSTPILLKQASG